MFPMVPMLKGLSPVGGAFERALGLKGTDLVSVSVNNGWTIRM